MKGNALPDGSGGDSALVEGETCTEPEVEEGSDVASGNGYSNTVELVAKGVPMIWEEGECRIRSPRFPRDGIVIRGRGDADGLDEAEEVAAGESWPVR
jgi:hypothetical protein